MALSRKMLKAMGIEEDKIEQIIEEHVESTDALKKQRDQYKAEAEEVAELKKKLSDAEAASSEDDGYKARYEAEKKSFADYKAKVDAAKSENEKRGLYRKLLEASGIDPKRVDSVLKVSDLSGVTVKDGALEGADELAESIKSEWADFVVQKSVEGAKVAHPPKAQSGGVTAEQFAKMGIRQRNELYKTDPDAYRALAQPKEQ